jgi:hypothetical protein
LTKKLQKVKAVSFKYRHPQEKDTTGLLHRRRFAMTGEKEHLNKTIRYDNKIL